MNLTWRFLFFHLGLLIKDTVADEPKWVQQTESTQPDGVFRSGGRYVGRYYNGEYMYPGTFNTNTDILSYCEPYESLTLHATENIELMTFESNGADGLKWVEVTDQNNAAILAKAIKAGNQTDGGALYIARDYEYMYPGLYNPRSDKARVPHIMGTECDTDHFEILIYEETFDWSGSVDGGWSAWSSWGACNPDTCIHTRDHTCNNPRPLDGGKDCEGPRLKEESCSEGTCQDSGGWSVWSPWGSCSVSCGSGKKTRTRVCHSADPEQCNGSDTLIESCLITSCTGLRWVRQFGSVPPGNGIKTGDWYVGRYYNGRYIFPGKFNTYTGMLSYCEPGGKFPAQYSTTHRYIELLTFTSNGHDGLKWVDQEQVFSQGVLGGNQSNGDPLYVARDQTTKKPGLYNPSAQNARIPHDIGSTCETSHFEVLIYEENGEIVHGGWSSWSAWGACSTTCGGGMKARTRSCTNPLPQAGGQSCEGSDRQNSICEGTPCPSVPTTQWSLWSNWGACSVPCGSGSKTRTRTCTGGQGCAGSPSGSSICFMQSCIENRDGKWSSWSFWGECSATCDLGIKNRTRSCSNPAPAGNGQNCAGSSTGTVTCLVVPCPRRGGWTMWSEWGACDATCGTGTRVRTRDCTNPEPSGGGSDCTHSGTYSGIDNQPCTSPVTCQVHNQWSSWSAWGDCTVTCGTGSKIRTRACQNPKDTGCEGLSISSESCTIAGNCPVGGAWTQWSAWASCSATCGTGSRTWTRSCTHPPPSNGGIDCVGATIVSESCLHQQCANFDCYSCDTTKGQKCRDPINEQGVTTVPCAGKCVTEETLRNSLIHVARSCVSDCIAFDGTIKALKVKTSCCDTNLCNNAPTMATRGPDDRQCYACDTVRDGRCRDPTRNPGLPTIFCAGKCLTGIGTFKNGTTVVIRECVKDCRTKDGTMMGLNIESTCCDTDKCNNKIIPVFSDKFRKQCYVCDDAQGDKCKTMGEERMNIAFDCPGKCATTTSSFNNGTTFVKRKCMPQCDSVEMTIANGKQKMACCDGHLCNDDTHSTDQKCFSCENCAEPFKGTDAVLVSCPGMCMKMNITQNGVTVKVSRGCSIAQCIPALTTALDGTQTDTSCCQGHKCNLAAKFTANSYLFLAVASVSILYLLPGA